MDWKVTFATTCWEKDWRRVLLEHDYLAIRQIGNQCFPFSERLLVINNVENRNEVERAAQEKIDSGVLTRFVFAKDLLSRFGLKRADFDDWQYYNALGPLNAIHEAEGEYLLFLTGDVYLKQKVSWIPQAIRYMEKRGQILAANLVWNDCYKEAKKESKRQTWNFFVSQEGFSDQMFLVRTKEFQQPIYSEIRADGAHYPRGDVWEKRVYSFLKNRQKERIIFKGGSYTHENIY